MSEKFIRVKRQRVRKVDVRKYEPRKSNDGKPGVAVFLYSGDIIVDWDQTPADIDKQMETE